jgi:peptide/nickel transport system substrate-binding protein
VDTSIWHAKVTRGEYAVGLNLTGVGVDDPDVNLYENYSCNSERNLTKYCNKDVDALIDKQSQELDFGTRKKVGWEIEHKLAEDLARPIIAYQRAATCWQPDVKGFSCCTRTASTTTGATRTCGWTSSEGARPAAIGEKREWERTSSVGSS